MSDLKPFSLWHYMIIKYENVNAQRSRKLTLGCCSSSHQGRDLSLPWTALSQTLLYVTQLQMKWDQIHRRPNSRWDPVINVPTQQILMQPQISWRINPSLSEKTSENCCCRDKAEVVQINLQLPCVAFLKLFFSKAMHFLKLTLSKDTGCVSSNIYSPAQARRNFYFIMNLIVLFFKAHYILLIWMQTEEEADFSL